MPAVKPSHIILNDIGIMTATLGKAELEMVAALIVRYHQANGFEDWVPLVRGELVDFMRADDVARGWATNPMWRPHFVAFVEQGWIAGWHISSFPFDTGILTQKFFDAITPKLWAVHVQGPDSIIAQPSFEAAEQRAAEWNDVIAGIIAGREPSPYAPKMKAVVVGWPYDRHSHTRGVEEHGGNPEDMC